MFDSSELIRRIDLNSSHRRMFTPLLFNNDGSDIFTINNRGIEGSCDANGGLKDRLGSLCDVLPEVWCCVELSSSILLTVAEGWLLNKPLSIVHWFNRTVTDRRIIIVEHFYADFNWRLIDSPSSSRRERHCVYCVNCLSVETSMTKYLYQCSLIH